MTSLKVEHPQIHSGDIERARHFSEKVLAEAKRQGASAAEVQVNVSNSLSVGVRLGEVENLETNKEKQLSVVVFDGQRRGVATTTDDSDAAIQSAVAAAHAIAGELEADPHAGLAAKEQLAQDLPDLDRYHPWALLPSDAIELARQCEAAGRADKRIANSEGAQLGSSAGLHWYANSNGFSAGSHASHHSLSCVLLAQDEQGMQRDYWYDSHCRADLLESAEDIGREAARRACARLGGRQPPTGRYPVVFAPQVAKSLLGHFISAVSGGNLYRNNSFLCDALGETLWPEWVNIGERPRLAAMPGSAAFDGDGLATREQQFVSEGRLQSYLLGLYSSRQLGMAPTGNGSGVHNLYISDSGQDQQQLLQQMGTGVLVTELMGQAVNPVTGDYSRGAAGFWVEQGEIAWPLEEFTLAANLKEMFAGLEASATDVDRHGRIHCGSLLLSSLQVAGQ